MNLTRIVFVILSGALMAGCAGSGAPSRTREASAVGDTSDAEIIYYIHESRTRLVFRTPKRQEIAGPSADAGMVVTILEPKAMAALVERFRKEGFFGFRELPDFYAHPNLLRLPGKYNTLRLDLGDYVREVTRGRLEELQQKSFNNLERLLPRLSQQLAKPQLKGRLESSRTFEDLKEIMEGRRR